MEETLILPAIDGRFGPCQEKFQTVMFQFCLPFATFNIPPHKDKSSFTNLPRHTGSSIIVTNVTKEVGNIILQVEVVF